MATFIKLKIAGIWTGTLEVNTEEWTVSMLREEVAKNSNCNACSINLICTGRLLKNDDDHNPKLIELGLKNNSKILASKICVDEGKSLQQHMLAEEQRSSRLTRLKAAVSALAQRHADGSLPIDDYNIEVANQKGQKLDMGSETDQRAIMTGLMLHTKGKELINAQQFKDALEVLEMGEEAFSLCDPKLIELIDNVPILQIDMVWCYFMLRDINLLSVAGERLAKAKKGIERAHGKDGSRVRLLHSTRRPELALYLRLEMLEGVAAFHSGDLSKARRFFTSAQAKFSKLQVSDEALSLLMSFGYQQHEAMRALKLNEQDVSSAVNFLEGEKEEKVKRREDNLKRQEEIREQKTYGKTPLGKAVNMEKLDALVKISFDKELAAEALRRHENDAYKALDALTNPETNSKIQLDIETKKRKRQEGSLDARISQLVSMGFEQSRVIAALNAHGTMSEALTELLAPLGEDARAAHSEYMRSAFDPAAAAAAAASSSAVDPENPTNEGASPSSSADGDDSPSSSQGEEEEDRDVEIEDELTYSVGRQDVFSDYDIDITKEAEALNEYLALLDSALAVGKPSSQ